MVNLLNLDAETGANAIGDDATPTASYSNTGGGPAFEVVGSTSANASISGLKLSNGSVASGAVMMLGSDSFVSVTTIKATTGGVAGTGVMRVVLTDGTFGWIPIYPDAAVTAATQA